MQIKWPVLNKTKIKSYLKRKRRGLEKTPGWQGKENWRKKIILKENQRIRGKFNTRIKFILYI